MKKIRYIPGMISIVLLPLLGMWYMNKHNYFQQLSAQPFTAMDFAEIEKINNEYGYNDFVNIFEKRINKEVVLNGNDYSKNTFEYIDQFVNNIIQTKDTINGLKIHFEEGATYNDFIEVLNIFTERGATTYTLDNNTMYFAGRDWKPPSPDDENLEPLGMFYCTSGRSSYEPKFNLQQFVQNLKKQFSQHKIIYSAYLFFVVIVGVSTIRKRNKKK